MQNGLIDIHTHKRYTNGTLYILSCGIGRDKQPPAETPYSAGIHPWDITRVDIETAMEYLKSAPVAAIGEIGLDYAIETDRDLQMQILEMQLRIAVERRLPVIIHCVKAYNDMLNILKKHHLQAVLFHGYIGTPHQAAEIINAGYYLSFGGTAFHSPKTIESLREVPLDRIFAETDDSGEDIALIYEQIAAIRNIPMAVLQQRIEDNFKRIFG